MPLLQEERDIATACGYGFVVGVSTQEHKDALLERDFTLNIVVTGASDDQAEIPDPHRLRARAREQRRSHARSRPRNRTGAPRCALGVGALTGGTAYRVAAT
ncbi:DUF6310 domain-containing protein [Stigmatella aurantiaca]|uniref:DUF6310 domain-containing protein n=1 Tax=Stigmatella aurantiaca TaxID=41 RepID=UPI0031835CA5